MAQLQFGTQLGHHLGRMPFGESKSYRVSVPACAPSHIHAARPGTGSAFAGTDQSNRSCLLARPNCQRLPVAPRTPMSSSMFAVSEAQTAAIRGAFDEGGEFSAAIELRRIFPAITNNATAREYARVIAGRDPPPPPSPPAHPPLHEVVPMHATKGHPAGSG